MNYLRSFAVLGSVLLLTVSSMTCASAQVSDAFVPGSLYDEVELMPYPTLAGPISLNAVGSSGEFTSSQEIESPASGVAILNWTHNPGVELHYNSSLSYPASIEHASFAENFSWSQSIQPTALRVSGYLQIKERAPFQPDSWSHMYDVQVWILGDTIQMTEVGSINSVEGYQHFSMTRSGYQHAFDALIQHSESHLQLVVALVPSWNYLRFQGTYLWKNYSGSVEVIISEIHLDGLYRTDPDLPHIRASTANNTWRIGESDEFVDSSMGKDGSLYILSHQQFGYSIQGDTLTKVNSIGKIDWRANLTSPSLAYWSRVLAGSSGVFLFGTSYYSNRPIMTVDMVGESGNISHAFNLDIATATNIGGVDIDPDGYLYIGIGISGSGEINILRKVSSNGTILWERPFGDDYYGRVSSVQIDESGEVFTFSQGQITKWNSQGDQLWQLSDLDNSLPGTKSLFALKDGSSIIVASQLRNSTIAYINPQGNQEWSLSNQISYAPGWSEAFYIPWITESLSGLLYALYTTYDIHQSTIVAVMNREGLQVENFTVFYGTEAYSSEVVPDYRRVYINRENLMYLVGLAVYGEDYHSLNLAIYEGEPGILGASQLALFSTSAAAGVIVGVLVFLEYYKKHRSVH